MATIIQLVYNGVLGLKFIASSDAAQVVTANDDTVDACRVAPTVEELKTLSRAFLLHLADTSGFAFVRSSNKTALAVVVSSQWENITNYHANLHWNVVSVFPRRAPRRVFQDEDDFAGIPAYQGQPHRQPDIHDFPTPSSLNTEDVLNSAEAEQFPDVSDGSISVADDEQMFIDDDSIHSLQGKTIYLASSSGGMVIHIAIPLKDGEISFDAVIDETTTLQSLFNEIQTMTNNIIPSDQMVGYVKDVSSECYPHESISWFCPKDGTLLIRPKLRGGGRSSVQKSFLKKADAVKALKKKMQTIYETDEDNNIPEDKLPASFNTFLQEQETALNEFLMMKTRAGQQFFALAVKHLQTEEVLTLKNILKPPKSGSTKNLTDHEKLSKAIHTLFPSLVKLNLCQNKLEYFKDKTLGSLMDAMIETYNAYNEGTGSINIDIQFLCTVVEGELVQRHVNPDVVNQEGNVCTVQ
eukprot:Skav218533  [mRNA]  locus=scaffold2478:371839:373239:+ [translate_table: standard]